MVKFESSPARCRVQITSNSGWRKYMEDAILFHRINKEIFLFAVFDGHGGVEVSQFCAKNIPQVL
jgi:protein phosphatase/protein phosphatase 2C family protein 2/3